MPPHARPAPSARSARCCSRRRRCCCSSSSSTRSRRCSGPACTPSTTRTPRRASIRRASRTTCARSTTSASGTRPGTRSSTSSSRCPGRSSSGSGLALLANQPFKVKWPVRLGAAAAVGAAAGVRGPHLPLVLRVQHRRRQRLAGARSASSRCSGCRARRSRSGDLHRDRLEGVVVHGADAARRTADDPEVALRGGRGRRRVEVAAVRRDHAADAAAGDLRRADLPHDHRDPDLRHPVRDDRRRARATRPRRSRCTSTRRRSTSSTSATARRSRR